MGLSNFQEKKPLRNTHTAPNISRQLWSHFKSEYKKLKLIIILKLQLLKLQLLKLQLLKLQLLKYHLQLRKRTHRVGASLRLYGSAGGQVAILVEVDLHGWTPSPSPPPLLRGAPVDADDVIVHLDEGPAVTGRSAAALVRYRVHLQESQGQGYCKQYDAR